MSRARFMWARAVATRFWHGLVSGLCAWDALQQSLLLRPPWRHADRRDFFFRVSAEGCGAHRHALAKLRRAQNWKRPSCYSPRVAMCVTRQDSPPVSSGQLTLDPISRALHRSDPRRPDNRPNQPFSRLNSFNTSSVPWKRYTLPECAPRRPEAEVRDKCFRDLASPVYSAIHDTVRKHLVNKIVLIQSAGKIGHEFESMAFTPRFVSLAKMSLNSLCALSGNPPFE